MNYRHSQVAGEHSVSVHQVSDSSHKGSRVQVAVDPNPRCFIVHRVEGVQLVVEQQQLLAVAAGRAVHPLLLPIDPVGRII